MKNKDKSNIVKYIKRCLPYFKKVKFTIILLLFIGLLVSITNSIFPAFIAKTLTLATEGKYSSSINLIIIVILVSIFIDLLNEFVFRFLYIKVENIVSNSIRKDVMDAYYKIDNDVLNKTPSGIFITRITDDPGTIVNKLNTVRRYIQMMLSNLFVIAYMFYLHYVFGIITLIGTIVIYLIESKSAILWSNFMKRRNKLKDERNSLISESIRGIHDIKLLNISDSFKSRIDYNLDKIYDDTLKSSKIDSLYCFARCVVMSIFLATVIIIGVVFVEKKIVLIATLTTLYMYKENMFSSILYFAWIKRELKEFALSAERVFEVIDGEEYKKEKYGTLRIEELKGDIEFNNVYFKYTNDYVLNGLSFKIKQKDSIAVVGKSGAGKTTIINLLSKMYKTTRGKITVDGYNLYDLDKHSIRNNISVIPQDPYIFNMTIRENLLIVKPEASNEEINNVLKVCELYDYVDTLPKKVDTLIGENGVTLSGGERQRLAIARALLKKSNIILFDEATSALDNETQDKIQKAINNISGFHTMIIIAHRLSTVKDCNKILVIDKGKVVGYDTHNRLLKYNGIYKNLYEKELQKY